MNSKPRNGLVVPKTKGTYPLSDAERWLVGSKSGHMPVTLGDHHDDPPNTLAAALALAIGPANVEELPLRGQVIDLGDLSGVASSLLKPRGVKP